jgi:hypothetical protein
VPKFLKQFLEIWAAWWNANEPISRDMLWGHPVFFWGRCGKMLELVAALFIIYDILGRERSSGILSRYTEVWSMTTFMNSARKVPTFYNIMAKDGFIKGTSQLGMWPVLGVYLILSSFVFFVLYHYTQPLGIIAILLTFIESFLVIFGIHLLTIVLLMLGGPPARLIAWLASKENRVRKLNLIVLVVGITLDLLAT